jgi:predicted DsbA family dithiol-disulfide isomerase
MRRLMQEEGLPYGSRTHTFNSRLAQELGAWADTQDNADVMHQALFHAYFVRGENIGEIETLVKIVEAVGLQPDEARDVLLGRRLQAAVDADWSCARALGITGVPTFVANGHGVVGAQPYDVLERLLVLAGASELAAE